jgi:hypothetical protein
MVMVSVESEAENTRLHLNEHQPLSHSLTLKENPDNRP